MAKEPRNDARRGPKTVFGPVHRRASVTMSRFGSQVLEAAASRSGKHESTVLDLLVRKYGGRVTADDFAFGDGDCAAAAE